MGVPNSCQNSTDQPIQVVWAAGRVAGRQERRREGDGEETVSSSVEIMATVGYSRAPP